MTNSSLLAREILDVTIEDELKQSYLDYAMSVIVGRALPDVRDGLKPVHRRVLYAMHELKNDWNKPYKKSARIVGDVIGKYHPHGDTAVYDTVVRMAQPFSLRYLLVDGQGNFGSVDGDAPAAMRYTEIRMTRLAHSLLADLEKDTVAFTPNYDESEHMPSVLPTRVPNLLVNGTSGIAVGMATNIPPHNLSEVVDAAIAMLEDPGITLDAIMAHMPGPDFPTAGIINGRAGIVSAYKSGRGRIYIRAKTSIETDEKTGRSSLLIHELPYQVNKARLLEKIAELVRDKKIEGISGLRDESDKDGMRVVIEIRRADQPEVVLNNLFTQTQLQTVFGINMVALDKGQPRLLTLKQLIGAFLQHRREVVVRRTVYELAKGREKAHILEGLSVALENIDPIIALIKQAKTPAAAKEKLLAVAWQAGDVAQLLERVSLENMRPENLSPSYGLQKKEGYRLSPEQAQAILDLRLHRLTGLEMEKIHDDYRLLAKRIQEWLDILADPKQLNAVVRAELEDVKSQFGDARRTDILSVKQDLTSEDLITEEEVVVTLSHEGYVKSQLLDTYQAQRRGGRGKVATTVREQDFVKNMLVANTHDTILCFSTVGKVYWLKVYQVPQGGRTSRGRPIVNLLPLDRARQEKISAILPIKASDKNHYIFMATEAGTVKKVPLSEFSRPRPSGKIAVELNPDDRLVGVEITDGEQDIMLVSNVGKAIRFREKDVRPMGRTARGVKGMKLGDGQKVIALVIAKENLSMLTATVNGFGQRTLMSDYRLTARGGQGVMAIQVSGRNGPVVSGIQVKDDDDVLLISDQGTLVRTRACEISCMGRNTQGVRLINLVDGETLVGVESLPADLAD